MQMSPKKPISTLNSGEAEIQQSDSTVILTLMFPDTSVIGPQSPEHLV